MTIEELNKTIRLYQSERGSKYGVIMECDPGTDITEENWLSIVNFTNGFGPDGHGIPCDPPMKWEDLEPYVLKGKKEKYKIDQNTRRVKAYPKVGELIDDLYHQGLFSPEMTARIRAVKEKYSYEDNTL